MRLITQIAFLLLMGVLLCGCTTSAAQGGAASEDTTNEQTRVAADAGDQPRPRADRCCLMNAIDTLKKIHTSSHETNIPYEAQPQLTALKHHLLDLIVEILGSEGADVSAQEIEARAIVDLRHLGIAVKEQGCFLVDENYVDKGYDYGQIHSITVTRPRPCFNLIAVTTTIGVCCGEDTSLYLFKREGPKWKLVLADEVNDYQSVSDARSTFEFGVTRPDDTGRFVVVATSVNPWCTSNWQRITYRVLRPGPAPYEPRVVLDRTEIIWLGDEPPYTLDVRDDRFTLSFFDERCMDLLSRGEEVSIDGTKGMRIIKYSVEGDSIRRKN